MSKRDQSQIRKPYSKPLAGPHRGNRMHRFAALHKTPSRSRPGPDPTQSRFAHHVPHLHPKESKILLSSCKNIIPRPQKPLPVLHPTPPWIRFWIIHLRTEIFRHESPCFGPPTRCLEVLGGKATQGRRGAALKASPPL